MTNNTKETTKTNTKENKITVQRKSLQGMRRMDMKKMCEALKTLGTKHKIDDNEKIILNNVLFCLQTTWIDINDNEEKLIQL